MSFGIPVRNGLAIGLLSSTTLSSNGGIFPAMYLDFLQPFLDSRVTFTRGSNATLVDATGKITYAPNNLIVNSNTFGSWPQNLNASIATGVSDPFGGTAASTLTATAVNGKAQTFVAATTAVANSIWVRRRTGSGTVSIIAANSSPQTITVTTAWQQFSTSASPASFGYVGVQLATSGDAVDIYSGVVAAVTYETTPRSGDQVITTASAYYGPRFDYDPVTLAAKGLLIEEQRTNLMFPADGTTGWGASPASSVTATANSITSPDGTTNATKLATNDTLSSAHTWYKTFSGAISTAYVGSVYLKAGEYTRAQVSFGNTGFASTTTGALFDLSNGTVVVTAGGSTATITAVGNGWYRCTVTATSDADGGNYVFGASPKPASVTTIDALYTPASVGLGGYVYGIQVEAGAFATSLIPTVASQVTRSADVATMTGTNFSSWYNQTEGTFVASFDALWTTNTISAHVLAATTEITQQNINRIWVWDGTPGVLRNTINSGGVNSSELTGATIIANIVFKAATAYQVNNYAFVTNGGTVATDTSGPVPVNLTRLGIGYRGDSLEQLNGHIRSIAYYNSRLPNAQLQALTQPDATLSLDFINGLYDA